MWDTATPRARNRNTSHDNTVSISSPVLAQCCRGSPDTMTSAMNTPANDYHVKPLDDKLSLCMCVCACARARWSWYDFRGSLCFPLVPPFFRIILSLASWYKSSRAIVGLSCTPPMRPHGGAPILRVGLLDQLAFLVGLLDQ